MNAFRTFFSQQGFVNDGGLFVTPGFRDSFGSLYSSLRTAEGRVHSDEETAGLPKVPANHPHRKEWRIRTTTLSNLVRHLKAVRPASVLEVGCGNGWLIHKVAEAIGAECCGVDVGSNDLRQAVRVFGKRSKLVFAQADILSLLNGFPAVDQIILAGCIQYFPDLLLTLRKLLGFLRPGGHLHLIDSPLYDSSRLPSARESSIRYFQNAGFPDMVRHYHHHDWKELEAFHYTIAYNPGLLINCVRRKLGPLSPFPWIIVTGPGQVSSPSDRVR